MRCREARPRLPDANDYETRVAWVSRPAPRPAVPDSRTGVGGSMSPSSSEALRLSRRFTLGHGLGNDYLVFDEAEGPGTWVVSPESVRLVCDRLRGVGSDGMVAVLKAHPTGRIPLRMFNPDGGEFERSGNGLRIAAAHLVRSALADEASPFEVEVGGDVVEMCARTGDVGKWDVRADMGRARLGASAVGLEGGGRRPDRVEPYPVSLPGPDGERISVVPVSVGNPHLVVFNEPLTERRLLELGPHLSGHPSLKAGANVQIAEVGSERVRALVWERGVGPTSSSGTSACAVATATVARGLRPAGEVPVEMPGGTLSVSVDQNLGLVLRGPVVVVATGELDASLGRPDLDRP